MPDDLTIPPVAASPREPLGASSPSAVKSAAPAAPLATTPLPSPSLHLDPELGIVVIEFRNNSGKLDSSIPTQRQLDAYRTAADRSSLNASKPPPPAPKT